MESFNLARIAAIHKEVQKAKPDLLRAVIKVVLVEISPGPLVCLHLVPLRYSRLGEELAETIHLGMEENVAFSVGFAARIGLNVYAECLNKLVGVHPLLFRYKKNFSKRGTDVSIYNENQLRQNMTKIATGVQGQYNTDKFQTDTWIQACLRSGQRLGTSFLASDINPSFIIKQLKNSKVEINSLRPPIPSLGEPFTH